MIAADRLNLTHVQWGNTCVMTAYSLVANYYVGEDIICPFYYYSEEFSADFNGPHFAVHCRHRGIAADDLVNRYRFFAQWRICDGGGTIGPDRSSNHTLTVHKQSGLFAHYRSVFDGEFIDQSLPKEGEVTTVLKEQDAITITGSGRHAILIYHDGTSLKVRNPVKPGAVRIDRFGDIIARGIGWQVADSILYRRIPKPSVV
jgi:hypothetical protein